MRTLIGGTVPSINPPKTAPGEAALLGLRDVRGDVTGAGGVCDLVCGESGTGAGGVGTLGCGGGRGAEWGDMPVSAKDQSSMLLCAGRKVIRRDIPVTLTMGPWPRIVGELVVCR
jgi:hypothetical protein